MPPGPKYSCLCTYQKVRTWEGTVQQLVETDSECPLHGDVKVGVCNMCGQELLLSEDDCWHPHTIATPCPPEALRKFYGENAWRDFRPGRPGRERWMPQESLYEPDYDLMDPKTLEGPQEAVQDEPEPLPYEVVDGKRVYKRRKK